MQLQENTIYTATELAEWFGITRKAFTNARQKKLKDLEIFCSYAERGRGKYLIEEVYYPEYDKNLLKTISKVADSIPKYLQSIDTCINVGTKINREVFNNKFSDKYIGALVGQIIKENPDKYHYQATVGTKKGENGYATFRLFNQQEQEIYYQTIKDCVQEVADDKVRAMQEAIDLKERGKISNKQFNEMDFDLSSAFNFFDFRCRLQQNLHLTDEEYANRIRNFDE